MLSKAVSLSVKREFVSWFLEKYELQKREAAWLLSYLTSDDRLLEKVHFVNSHDHLPKLLIISTGDVKSAPFEFHKNNTVTPDVEKAFHDLRLNPHEDVYVSLEFKDRVSSPEYTAVLEVNPMEKQDVVHGTVLGLLAEMVLDEALRNFRKKKLYTQIDEALKLGDQNKFMELTNELKELQHL
jgi:uncharacterized protein YpiB (UPF0302 family)